MRNQAAFQTVENIVALKQSRLSIHSQYSVKILNIAQMAITLLLTKILPIESVSFFHETPCSIRRYVRYCPQYILRYEVF